MSTLNEAARGNRYLEGSFEFPLGECERTPVDKGRGPLGVAGVFGRNLYASRGGYLACFSLADRRMLWDVSQDAPHSMSCKGDESHVYVTRDRRIVSLDAHNGNEIWCTSDEFTVRGLSDTHVFSTKLVGTPRAFCCHSRSNGRVLWSFDDTHGSVGSICVERNIVVVSDGQAYYSLDEKSGSLLWRLDSLPWLEERFSDRVQAWRKRSGGGGELSPQTPHTHLGCLIDGVAYISWDIGVILAIDAETGRDLWAWEFPEGREFHVAKTIIHRKGCLYFHDNQWTGSESYLYCLDSSTGSMQFMTDEKVTPKGCSNAVMVGKHFVGGSRDFLAAYDVETRERAWLFKHPESEVFRGPAGVFPQGLVFAEGAGNILHWFIQSKEE